jgi:pimeloyl-ACP methyl ester carboxylesterase
MKTILLFLLALLLFYSCTESNHTQETSIPKRLFPSTETYTTYGANLQYALVNSKKNKLVLFIHGSPGSSDAFSEYLEDMQLQEESILISIDRFGYGGSMHGLAELSIGNQARYIKPILDKYNLPTLIVGHSYGGPVALRMAMDYPEQVTSILLLAPSIDPDLEKLEWFQRLGNHKIIRFFLPSFIDVSNQEILPLQFELKKMEHLWKSLKTPMTIIQGDNDSLVPPHNADYAEKMYPDKSKLKIIRGDMNHFLPWNQRELVKKEILGIITGME